MLFLKNTTANALTNRCEQGAIVISCVFPSKFNSKSRVALKAKIAELTVRALLFLKLVPSFYSFSYHSQGVVAKDVLIERVSKIIDGKLKVSSRLLFFAVRRFILLNAGIHYCAD